MGEVGCYRQFHLTCGFTLVASTGVKAAVSAKERKILILSMNWELEFQKKTYVLEIYIYYWLIQYDCNMRITHPALGKHYVYTFHEFYHETINAEAGLEPLWRYYLRRKIS